MWTCDFVRSPSCQLSMMGRERKRDGAITTDREKRADKSRGEDDEWPTACSEGGGGICQSQKSSSFSSHPG